MINDINTTILDWMIAEREFFLAVNAKNNAVRNQDFEEASKLLEKQREIEKRMPTMEQLQELKLYYQNNTSNEQSK